MLANTKWNTLEVLIPKLLIKTFISHDEFALVNNVLKEYVWYKRKNQELRDCNSSPKILFYLQNNATLLFEVFEIAKSKCAVCDKKMSFIKEKIANRLLSSLGWKNTFK